MSGYTVSKGNKLKCISCLSKDTWNFLLYRFWEALFYSCAYGYVLGSHVFKMLFCGCETWSSKSREQRELPVSENRVLRRMVERKRQIKKIYDGGLRNLY